jgi:hypothetical protein
MYKEVNYCVKIDQITQPISSNTGVKQGCALSPLLLNIYLSDLPNIFDNTCSPATLYDQQLNCLMFTDDIVLLSVTSVGLQRRA